MDNCKRHFKTIWKTLCFSLVLFETFRISSDYLARLTVTNGSFRDDLAFPGSTLCISGLENVSLLSSVFKVKPMHNAQPNVSLVDYNKAYPCFTVVRIDNVQKLVIEPTRPLGIVNVYFYLHSSLTFPYGHDMATFEFGLDPYYKDNPNVEIPFMRRTLTQLPAPYPSNCLDYTALKYQSHAHCIEACISRKLPFSKLPLSYNLLFGDETQSQLCLTKCQNPDCYSENYIHLQQTESFSGAGEMRIYELTSTMALEMVPVLSFEVYIIYVFGVAGSYVGLCLFDSPDYIFFLGGLLKNSIFHFNQANCSVKSRKILRFFSAILCIAGCFWQIVQISETYFSYATASELYIGNPTSEDIPSITFCYEISKLLREKYIQRYASQFKILNYSDITNWTSSPEELFQVQFINPKSTTYYRNIYKNAVTFFFESYKCFKIIVHNDASIKRPEDYKLLIPVKKFHVDFVINDKWGYWFLRDKNDLSGLQTELYQNPPNRMGWRSYQADFIALSRTLLEYPYYTNCVYYPKNQNRISCIDKCLPQNMPKTIFSPFQAKIVIMNTSLEIEHLKLKYACMLKCKKNCVQNNYFLINYAKMDFKAKNSVRLVKNQLETRLILKASTTTIDFLMYIINIIGFWIGISIASSINVTFEHIVRVSAPLRNSLFTAEMLSKVWVVIPPKTFLVQRFRTLITFGIFCGFLYHISFVLGQYFDYDVITDTSMSLSSMTSPALTLCVCVEKILRSGTNLTNAALTYLCYNSGRPQPSITELIRRTLSFHEITMTLAIRKANQFYVNSSLVPYNIKEFYTYNHKCFRLKFTQQDTSQNTNLFQFSNIEPYLAIIRCSKMFGPVSLQIHDKEFFSRISHMNAWLNHCENYNMVLKASLTENSLLPPPFKTKCFDYTSTKFRTRKNCVDQCILKETFDQLGLVFNMAPRYENNNISGKPTDVVPAGIVRLCNEKCVRTDCFSQTFIIDQKKCVVATKKFLVAVSPTKSEIRTTFIPKMVFSQLFLFVVGVACLWFGVDLMSSCDVLTSVVLKMKRKTVANTARRNTVEDNWDIVRFNVRKQSVKVTPANVT